MMRARSAGTASLRAACCLWAVLAGCSAREIPPEAPAEERPRGAVGGADAARPEPSAASTAPAATVPAPDEDPLEALDLRHPPPEVVRAILELAGITKDDPVFVLGCGDGGVAIGAARSRGARVVAIDPSAQAIARARENARKAGVEGLVSFHEQSPVEAEIAGAQVVVVLLPRSSGKQIEHKLQTDLKPGTRVVSWLPAVTQLGSKDEESGTLYLYRVPGDSHPESLAPYVQTPIKVVDKMLEMAELTKDDVLYDLGCGDGRIVVEAAKRHGVRAVGIDFDARRIQEARERARREGVERLVEFRQEDILKTDISPATVVTLFLLPDSNRILKPKLATLRPGARILSHQFDTEGWTYRRKEILTLSDGSQHTIYLWGAGEALEDGAARQAKSPPR